LYANLSQWIHLQTCQGAWTIIPELERRG
jgi:hypothetical protein